MSTAAQAESPLLSVKPPVPEAFKGSMDGKTILNLIHICD